MVARNEALGTTHGACTGKNNPQPRRARDPSRRPIASGSVTIAFPRIRQIFLTGLSNCTTAGARREKRISAWIGTMEE